MFDMKIGYFGFWKNVICEVNNRICPYKTVWNCIICVDFISFGEIPLLCDLMFNKANNDVQKINSQQFIALIDFQSIIYWLLIWNPAMYLWYYVYFITLFSSKIVNDIPPYRNYYLLNGDSYHIAV